MPANVSFINKTGIYIFENNFWFSLASIEWQFFLWLFWNVFWIFSEYKKKLNLKDIEKEDAVLFNTMDTWHFIKEKSGGLTGDEMITIPHAAILVREHVHYYIWQKKGGIQAKGIWKQDPEANIWAQEKWKKLHNEEFHSLYRSPNYSQGD